ncbi:MAG: hypothetical protein AAFQ88_03800 [Pseudomonadota bacterium]
MVLALLFLLGGFAFGWWRAGRRGGNRGDRVQMGLAHGIPFALLGFVIAITVVNMGG